MKLEQIEKLNKWDYMILKALVSNEAGLTIKALRPKIEQYFQIYKIEGSPPTRVYFFQRLEKLEQFGLIEKYGSREKIFRVLPDQFQQVSFFIAGVFNWTGGPDVRQN